jgi:isoleucyl-tRNA synthetase
MAYPLSTIGNINSVESNIDFSKLEEQVLEFWDKQDTFQKSLQRTAGIGTPVAENSPSLEGVAPSGDGVVNSQVKEFVFYDGPPFANGLPHYGHLLTGYVKDVVPRYKTMQGYHVDRVFGWDTHGLPAELEAERELGLENGKADIDEMGLEAFNDACRKSVMKYTDVWKSYVRRQARWVDFDNGYKTLDLNYMESTIWAFKELYKKDLVYLGFKVLPYCFRDQTPLSNHELRMDADVYQDRQDTSVTVGVRLETGELIVVWTTTPWTLPSNLLVAVGPEVEYLKIKPKSGDYAGETIIIGKARIGEYSKEFGEVPGEDYEIVDTVTGKDLEGLKYSPMFSYYNHIPNPNAYKVVVADYVSTEDGTGAVHIAPYGEEDMVHINYHSVKPVLPVDNAGKFNSEIPDYEGMHVFDANKPIIKDLSAGTGNLATIDAKERCKLIQAKSYVHSYPHCWRCRTPLIYKPVSSWFVAVNKIKDKLLKLNERINWIPSNVKDGQFGKWLENAIDWSISRNRYWGSPIPVWQSDDPKYPRTDVYGSLQELEQDFGVKVDNLHRPFIDELTRPNPDDPTGKSTMRRITDVFDCWFESGSMSFCQKHYPFENGDWFNSHFPGDFIVEYIGQTRGWFYTMHIMATALFDCNGFENVLCHGIILGNDGQKMSKSLRNYPDVEEVFTRDGADAMRWFLMSSSILRGGNLIVTEEGIRDATRKVIIPLWSAYYFFTLYANACSGPGVIPAQAGIQTPGATNDKGYLARHVLPREIADLDKGDRYILSKTHNLVSTVTDLMDKYEISEATEVIQEYIEVLNNWYIRTNRERFWNEDKDAFNTLYTCLEYLMKIVAPLLPMVSEVIYKGLTGVESVHLESWPNLSNDREANLSLVEDTELVALVDEVREIISETHSIRKASKLRVRLPLQQLTIISDNTGLTNYEELIKTELNVKTLAFLTLEEAEAKGFKVDSKVNLNPRAMGPRLGKSVQFVIKAVKSGNYTLESGVVTAHTDEGDIALESSEFELETIIATGTGAGTIESRPLSTGGFISLDTFVTPELEIEGDARDIIRDIQKARKDAELDVSDRIRVKLHLPKDKHIAVTTYLDLIKSETLTNSYELLVADKKFVEVTKN